MHEMKGRPSVASVWLNSAGRREVEEADDTEVSGGMELGGAPAGGGDMHMWLSMSSSGGLPRRRISSGKATEHVLIGVCQMSVPAR
jgi:hypothetical protein